MKTIPYSKLVDTVASMCMRAACELPADVLESIGAASASDRSPLARRLLEQCVENAVIAARDHIPICQDTGFAVFFVVMGAGVCIDGGTITQAITEGTARGYREGVLRASIVNDPLFDRKNTRDNTPPVVHIEIVPGEALEMTLLPKGGGSENMSALAMLKPSQGEEGVIGFVVDTVIKSGGNPCPPVIVGVGIGGTADTALLISKKALLRPLGSAHADTRYSALERRILDEVNKSGIGAQGLGGSITALGVHIDTYPCHIASLPVAVSLNCHAARRIHAEL